MKHLNEKDGQGMDMNTGNNYTRLVGVMAGRPVFSHSARGEEFFCFPLEITRLSGAADRINIIIRREQLAELEAEEREKLCVIGQLRSFNNRRGTGARLVITVFAREIFFCEEPDCNEVYLRGTLCKPPNLRTTPMGRDICDLMLAVNRHYGRSDYLPCICWGPRARTAAGWEVGTVLSLEGRIQSRLYIKLSESGAEERTAFEVSAAELEALTEETRV